MATRRDSYRAIVIREEPGSVPRSLELERLRNAVITAYGRDMEEAARNAALVAYLAERLKARDEGDG